MRFQIRTISFFFLNIYNKFCHHELIRRLQIGKEEERIKKKHPKLDHFKF